MNSQVQFGDVIIFKDEDRQSVVVETKLPIIQAAWILRDEIGNEKLSYPGTRDISEIEERVGHWVKSRIITGLVNQMCMPNATDQEIESMRDLITGYLDESETDAA